LSGRNKTREWASPRVAFPPFNRLGGLRGEKPAAGTGFLTFQSGRRDESEG
jgi:hypothetical protein